MVIRIVIIEQLEFIVNLWKSLKMAFVAIPTMNLQVHLINQLHYFIITKFVIFKLEVGSIIVIVIIIVTTVAIKLFIFELWLQAFHILFQEQELYLISFLLE